jgi:Methyltransferase domain
VSRPRVVTPEALDHLPVDDPRARRSRRDLQRVHKAMGTRGALLRAMRRMAKEHRARHQNAFRVLELGAGDGSLLLGVARAGRRHWPDVELSLLDRQPVIERETLSRYADAGWAARVRVMDVMDWARNPFEATPAWNLIVANLFLHHFEPPALTMLLEVIASRTERFLALEPRRSALALVGSRLVGLLGANAVTRQDAVLSVHAGFRDDELTRLWPKPSRMPVTTALQDVRWRTREHRAGLFSHSFAAERLPAA